MFKIFVLFYIQKVLSSLATILGLIVTSLHLPLMVLWGQYYWLPSGLTTTTCQIHKALYVIYLPIRTDIPQINSTNSNHNQIRIMSHTQTSRIICNSQIRDNCNLMGFEFAICNHWCWYMVTLVLIFFAWNIKLDHLLQRFFFLSLTQPHFYMFLRRTFWLAVNNNRPNKTILTFEI